MPRPIPQALAPLFAEYRRRLETLLGDRFVELRLYGSWARGEQGPDSDVDVVVLVHKTLSFDEDEEVRGVGHEIGWRFHQMLSIQLFPLAHYRQMVKREHPYYEAVEAEGIPA
ncbi:MAG: nucleotidyltransferase domain-containing protein [Myxococcales bacterium]